MHTSGTDTGQARWHWLARLGGFSLALAYLIIGTLFLLVLLVGGLWEGFARDTYRLMFLGAFVYVYGTAWLAFSFGRRPERVRGVTLAVLVAPVAVQMFLGIHSATQLRSAAKVYVADVDPVAVAEARETLLARGQRSGRHDYIDLLLDGLEDAADDKQRIRLVELLGKLSYQHQPLLETLRTLHRETENIPERRDLHKASLEAILSVNPHEQGLPDARAAAEPLPRRAAGQLEVEMEVR